MCSGTDVANWFLTRAAQDERELTHLKLQKLVYYAQAWVLTLTGQPIFREDFEAWAHGPVLPSLWRKYQGSGFDPLPREKPSCKFDSAVKDILDEVYQHYGEFTAKRLEKMTHEEAPWKNARGNLAPHAQSSAKISKPAIKAYYSRFVEA